MKNQEKRTTRDRATLTTRRQTGGKATRFPGMKGRVIENVEFAYTREGHTLSLHFQDGHELDFEIEPGLSVTASLTQWKAGHGRVIRKWPPMRNA